MEIQRFKVMLVPRWRCEAEEAGPADEIDDRPRPA